MILHHHYLLQSVHYVSCEEESEVSIVFTCSARLCHSAILQTAILCHEPLTRDRCSDLLFIDNDK